jgi:predicted N-acetyltransferase YhbS
MNCKKLRNGRNALQKKKNTRAYRTSRINTFIKTGVIMEHLHFMSNYSSDKTKREALYPLFETVFGIETAVLQDFYKKGFWNPTYCPFTLFDGEQAVANVSMFSLPLMINGTLVQAAGIQSVMTHPEYRGKGFMKKLFTEMLAVLDKKFEASFLFTEAPELYIPFGFRSMPQYCFTADMDYEPNQQKQPLKRLDFFNPHDLLLIQELFQSYKPVSHMLAPIDHASSFYLNMYNPYFHKNLYYSKELHALLVFELQGETLKLYDMINNTIPSLDEVCSQIPYSISRVELYFCPDLFDTVNFEPKALHTGTHFMVRGSFAAENEYIIFPKTAAF